MSTTAKTNDTVPSNNKSIVNNGTTPEKQQENAALTTNSGQDNVHNTSTTIADKYRESSDEEVNSLSLS